MMGPTIEQLRAQEEEALRAIEKRVRADPAMRVMLFDWLATLDALRAFMARRSR